MFCICSQMGNESMRAQPVEVEQQCRSGDSVNGFKLMRMMVIFLAMAPRPVVGASAVGFSS
jgi:hypothetical protein